MSSSSDRSHTPGWWKLGKARSVSWLTLWNEGCFTATWNGKQTSTADQYWGWWTRGLATRPWRPGCDPHGWKFRCGLMISVQRSCLKLEAIASTINQHATTIINQHDTAMIEAWSNYGFNFNKVVKTSPCFNEICHCISNKVLGFQLEHQTLMTSTNKYQPLPTIMNQ